MHRYIYCICNTHPVVTITTPPENITVCRGSDVNISCGYLWVTALPVTWIINGTSLTQEEVANSPLYRLNFPTSPMFTSLTVFSINATTTFQCIVLSTPTTTSTRGTVIVINGTYIHIHTSSSSTTIGRIHECMPYKLLTSLVLSHQYCYYTI